MKIKELVDKAVMENGIRGAIFLVRSKKRIWIGDIRFIEKKYYRREIFVLEFDEADNRIRMWI